MIESLLIPDTFRIEEQVFTCWFSSENHVPIHEGFSSWVKQRVQVSSVTEFQISNSISWGFNTAESADSLNQDLLGFGDELHLDNKTIGKCIENRLSYE